MERETLVVTVEIEGKELKMEVDTGAAVSLVSYETYCHLLPEIALSPSNVVLRTYSGELINVAGSCKVEVCHNGQKVVLDLIVVDGRGSEVRLEKYICHERKSSGCSVEKTQIFISRRIRKITCTRI